MERRTVRSVGRDGFTVIEMVFVLVALAILAGIAIPNMSGVVSQTHVNDVSTQLTTDVAYARMLAVRSGAPVSIALSGTSYQILANGTVGKRVDFAQSHPGLLIAPETELVFNSRGLLAAGASQTITITRQGQVGTLRILPTGRTYRE
jgi:prepilin-type N-terminal cleavage/methylation domain-containing protein